MYILCYHTANSMNDYNHTKMSEVTIGNNVNHYIWKTDALDHQDM